MTAETQIANIIWTGGAVLLVWAIARFFAIPAIRDTLRYRLFAVRRDMFLFMARGGIDADHPAYGRVRSLINTSIRYADGLSLSRGLVAVITARGFGKEKARTTDQAIDSLPEESQQALREFRTRAHRAVGAYMIVRSPLGWLLVVAAVPIVVLVAITSILPLRRLVGSLGRRVEEEAQVIKCLEEEGASMAA